MFSQCFLVVVLSSILTCAATNNNNDDDQYRGHILKIDGKYQTVIASVESYTEPDNVLATGFWAPIYNKTGWSVLEIKTLENQTNIDQAYSAGLLEGRFTRELITMQWQNSIAGICTDKQLCDKLKDFFQIQLNWAYAQIDANPNNEYWHQVELLLIQLNGLIDGYDNKTRGPRKELDDPLGFLLFQTLTSIGDIATHLDFTNFPQQDHCSALIKLLPDNKDVILTHATWDSYHNMLRILKRYTMPLKRTSAVNSTIIPGYDVIFSTYPGTIQSNDDFYMARSTNLAVIETTINIYNHDLYRNIKPQTVSEWMRVIIANRLAKTGREWTDLFFMYNDGTYNNQWMIADYKQFTPGQSPKPGFLTIAEQLITYSESADMTNILKNTSYWASYNKVYFPNFRNLSGEDTMVKEKGDMFSWYNCSRAKIFRRDHSKVVDIQSMIHMIRFNDFQHDPLSTCNCTPPYSATLTIAARYDLNDINGTYPNGLGFGCGGASDAKIVNHKLMQDFSLVAIAGPTTDHQKPFVWSESYCNKLASHIGQPDKWNFEPYSPVWKLS